MIGRFEEFQKKWVVDARKGTIIGRVVDLEIDFDANRVVNLVAGNPRPFFFRLKRRDESVIGWSQIQLIGEDAILVQLEPPLTHSL